MAICIGFPDSVSASDPSVLIDVQAVVRLGDPTAHGGFVVEGSDEVIVNGVPAAFVTARHVCPMAPVNVPHVGGPIAESADPGVLGGEMDRLVGEIWWRITTAAMKAAEDAGMPEQQRKELLAELAD